MGGSSRLTRAIQYAVLILLILGSITLLGQMRGFLGDVTTVLRAVLTPVIVSIVIAYLLDPIVEVLVRRKVPRGVSVLIIYIVFILIFLVLLMNTIPVLVSQLGEFGHTLPATVHRIDQWVDMVTAKTRYLPDNVRVAVEARLQSVQLMIGASIAHILQNIGKMVGQLLNALVIPFLVFYMLKDQKLLERAAVSLIPRRHRENGRAILRDIDTALGSYIRGQLLVMLVVGILTYAGLLVVRMPYALLFAMIVAITNIIPYFGPFIGAAPMIVVALTVSPWLALKVAIVNLVVQQLEGNVVSPQIVGRTLHIHPMVIIVSLLFAGELAGVMGLIVAVPLVAVCKVIGERLLKAHQN